MNIKFSDEFYNLGSNFYTLTKSQKKTNPKLLIKNQTLLHNFAIDADDDELTAMFSGNKTNYVKSMASVYAGHQFGSFNPNLGDGRALILGNIRDNNTKLHEIGIKGSGVNSYSRNGDGMLAVGPAIREYLISEYMRNVNIPTTYSLAITISDDQVIRENILQSAVLTRISKSFIRVGSYEYFLYTNNVAAIKQMSHYLIKNHFSAIDTDDYISFFAKVCDKQAKLIANWQSLGFIHGVMNTDNMSVVGETIDYGPCAFLDDFKFNKVFSSIDHYGRYAFVNQPKIAVWNLTSFANCLLALIDDKKYITQFEEILANFDANFNNYYYRIMSNKLAINYDKKFVDKVLFALNKNQIDYTDFFTKLSYDNDDKISDDYNAYPDLLNILKNWRNLRKPGYKKIMQKINPYLIPRNHQIEKAIKLANAKNFDYFFKLNNAVNNPFVKNTTNDIFAKVPDYHQKITHTFCGT